MTKPYWRYEPEENEEDKKIDKITGKGWEIILDKNTRGIVHVTSLIIDWPESDGYDAAQIETKEDYQAFQNALKEYAKKLGW